MTALVGPLGVMTVGWLVHVHDVLTERYARGRPLRLRMSCQYPGPIAVQLNTPPGSWLVSCHPSVWRHLQAHLLIELFLEQTALYSAVLGQWPVGEPAVRNVCIPPDRALVLSVGLDSALEWWEDLNPIAAGGLKLPFSVTLPTRKP